MPAGRAGWQTRKAVSGQWSVVSCSRPTISQATSRLESRPATNTDHGLLTTDGCAELLREQAAGGAVAFGVPVAVADVGAEAVEKDLPPLGLDL